MTFSFVDPPPGLEVARKVETKEIDGNRHYVVDGDAFPSITTVLSLHNKEIIENWRKRVGEKRANEISKAAADRGNQFHDMCEVFLKTGSEERAIEFMKPKNALLLKRIRPLLEEKITDIQVQEVPLFTKKWKTAGRVDLIAKYAGINSVIDFKGSGSVKPDDWVKHYFAQAGAYAYMYRELTGEVLPQIVIIMAGEDGSMKVWRKPWDIELQLFRDMRTKWYNEYGT